MKVNTRELISGLDLKKKYLIDVNGRVFSAEDYIKQYHIGAEMQRNKKLVPRYYERPLGLQLELTSKCNQKCIHCYNQSNDKEHNILSSELSIDEWKAIANQAKELDIFQCVISGGEPTILGDKLFEIMDILDEASVRFVVISNGMLLDEYTVERFKKYKYSWFQISIDGSRKELHNKIRGAEAFEKAINAANLIKEAGIPLVIAHSVMKYNIDYLEEMIDLCYLLGAIKVITGPFSYMGRAVRNSDLISLTDEECKKVYEICDAKALEYMGRMQVTVSAEESTSLRVKLAEPNSVMLIRPNGDVKFDCVSPFKIGNVRENTLLEIWESKGKYVYSSKRLLEYIQMIKSSRDLLKVHPRVNVDPDELLTI